MNEIKKEYKSKMKRKWGMAIDLDKCTGCGQCSLACSQENNMPVLKDDSYNPQRVSFMEVMKVTNDRDAKYPDVNVAYIPKMCQQCAGDGLKPIPPCVSVCLVVATDVGDDGVVSQIWSRCIGCRYCMSACPYEARVFNWWKPEYDKRKNGPSFIDSLNPDVSVASRGTVVKCTFCSHIWKKERDKAVAAGKLDINDVLYKPACAASCPTGAIVFGDLNDPTSEVAKLSKDKRAMRLVHTIDEKSAEEQAKWRKIKNYANPKVYYLSSKQWIRDMMRFK